MSVCSAVVAHNLRDLSPVVALLVLFRAAEQGNFEAAVKLGIAYLYNEGCKSRAPDVWWRLRYAQASALWRFSSIVLADAGPVSPLDSLT